MDPLCNMYVQVILGILHITYQKTFPVPCVQSPWQSKVLFLLFRSHSPLTKVSRTSQSSFTSGQTKTQVPSPFNFPVQLSSFSSVAHHEFKQVLREGSGEEGYPILVAFLNASIFLCQHISYYQNSSVCCLRPNKHVL